MCVRERERGRYIKRDTVCVFERKRDCGACVRETERATRIKWISFFTRGLCFDDEPKQGLFFMNKKSGKETFFLLKRRKF